MRGLLALACIFAVTSAATIDRFRPDDRLEALIVDGQNNHAWAKTTPLLKAILENSGRFTVDVATSPPKGQDLAGFRPDFAGYDVVVSNYNGALWPESTREALVDYVKGGGAFVVVHAANNAFPKWEAYNRIIGVGGWGKRSEQSGPYVRLRDGKFVRDETPGRGGSHGQRHEFVVETRAPDHPIVAGLPARWRHAADELYDSLRGPAEELTVLATAFADPKTRGSGEHEPMLMTIGYGKGRVFHTTLGHDPTAIRCVGFQTILARGAEWAATGAVTIGVPDDFPTADATSVSDPIPVALFDGTTLNGWTQRNGTATYQVEDGAIVGRTAEGSPNSFLCTERDYGDFELVFEVKVDDQLNSGVQIRSRSRAGDGRVHGPQVEIEAGPAEAGHVYSEATGRGWLSQEADRKDPKKRAAFNNGAWNHYRVVAVGPRIRTWVNGVPIADITDEKSSQRGFIGLQVHGISRGSGPFEVRWRALRIRER